jgi:hypothetical protein
MHDLRCYLGPHQTKPVDPEAEKRAGWRRYGILVIIEQDPRLSWPERELGAPAQDEALRPAQEALNA